MTLTEFAEILGRYEIIIVPLTDFSDLRSVEEQVAIEQTYFDEEEEEDFEPLEVDEFMEQEAPQAMEEFDNYVHSCLWQPQTI